ncbi:3-dehydroquinate synthase [Caldinitratiruptor microaerophilus]|uniref:3-dehydroquinate synthase n=1 Tax=Caldinitratiruptor microaerophilus TaxID=671077 RepID=A0AA35CJC9_9FIRM|nr:3-dehydroquinate synthase [Caldinitratiruptor microaerophilus]BDG60287.1 3-dehydroquinate synthase [Caldinitratiruptor microaerophilus]
MARTVRVELGERSYRIHIGSGILADLGHIVRETLPRATRALVVTDEGAGPHYLDRALAALRAAGIEAGSATVPAGEPAKTLSEAARLYEACLDTGLDRDGCVVALGGGAVGDLAGFVAATFLRGVDFVQVPTTLLAQVDASIGGKVAVNLPRGKNLVGAFHQPRAVVADVTTLATLPAREYVAGLAEVVKHALLRDRGLFALLEDETSAVLARDPALLEDLVERNCRIKGAVVSADEREGGLRAILNLGHTVGHGVEAVLGRVEKGEPGATPREGLLHGECVSIGLIAAAWLSRRAGVLAQDDLPGRLEDLLRRLTLPVRLPPGTDLAAVREAMRYDKKARAGRLRWVLPVRVGQVQVTEHVRDEDVEAVLADLSRPLSG